RGARAAGPGRAAGGSGGVGGADCWPLASSGWAVAPDGLAGRLTAAARAWALGRDIRPSAVARRREGMPISVTVPSSRPPMAPDRGWVVSPALDGRGSSKARPRDHLLHECRAA